MRRSIALGASSLLLVSLPALAQGTATTQPGTAQPGTAAAIAAPAAAPQNGPGSAAAVPPSAAASAVQAPQVDPNARNAAGGTGPGPTGPAPTNQDEIAPMPPAAAHAAPAGDEHPGSAATGDAHSTPHLDGHASAAHGDGHAEAAHGGGGHHEEAEDGAPGAINFADFANKHQPPLLALLINFAILMFVYIKYGKKPIGDGLKERRDAIAKDIENASKILAEAEERAETYQSKLAKKDVDSKEATASLVKAGEAERERILEEAKEKAARLQRDAAFMREQEVKQLQQDLVKETVERAIADAEALLKKGVTQADQERLAEEYLATLGNPQSQGAS